MADLSGFVKRLKELRTKSNATQAEVADYIGISARNYRNYEAGIMEPSAFKAALIAEYFNVSTDYLLGKTDNSTRL